MRYELVAHPLKPDFYLLRDLSIDQFVCELALDHATVVWSIYVKTAARSVLQADDFMFGHVLGVAMALIHGDKYVKVKKLVNADGTTSFSMIDPQGQFSRVVAVPPFDEIAKTSEVFKRVTEDPDGNTQA